MNVKLRQKPLKSGAFSLYLDYSINGKREKEYLNIHLEAETSNEIKKQNKERLNIANQVRNKRQYELETRINGLQPQHNNKLNIYDFFAKAIETKSLRTANQYKRSLSELQGFSNQFDYLPLSKITTSFIENFVSYLLSKNYKQSTVKHYTVPLKTILNELLNKEIILVNPFKKASIKLAKTNIVREYLNFDELNKLYSIEIKNLKENQYLLLFIFVANTGLRYSDLQRIKWNDIKTLQDNKGNKYKRLELIQKKTKETVFIPLNTTAENVLKEYKRLFGISTSGLIFDFIPQAETANVNHHLKKFVSRAGIEKNITIHSLRHSFATNYLTLPNGNLYTLQKLLGHTDISTTQIYAKMTNEKLKETINNFPNIEFTKEIKND